MKNKFNKIISSLLILAFLASVFTVFSFADGTETEGGAGFEDKEELTVVVNREYDEGWDALNGFSANLKDNKATIEYEETADFDYNYYTRMEALNSSDGYLELKYGSYSAKYGNTILEMDYKLDDANDIGRVAYMRASTYTFSLAAIKDNALYLLAPGYHEGETGTGVDPSYYVGALGNGWIHIAMVFTVNQRTCPTCGKKYEMDASIKDSDIICEGGEESGCVKVGNMDRFTTARIYFGYADTFNPDRALNGGIYKGDKDLTNTYFIDVNFDKVQFLEYIRFGMPASHTAVGSSYLLDNVKAYNGVSKPTKLADDDYGINVIETQAKTEQILSANAEKTAVQYIAEGLVMKVGVNYCLDNNERRTIFEKDGVSYGAPVKIDGKVYVPLQAILDWIGYPMYQHDDGLSYDIATENGSTFVTIGRNTATSNGVLVPLDAAPGYATSRETGEQYLVIALSDVEHLFEGYHVTYDEMGLMVISLGADLFDRSSDLDLMLDIMRSFIYDYNTADEYYASIKANTNNFQHPYILANQDDFDKINAAYLSEGGDLKDYATAILAKAEAVYAKYANTDPAAVGKYLASEIVNPNADAENNGYDAFVGRLEAAADYNEELRLLALAYQITRDNKYAHLGYEFAVSMGRWEHWGPAYFVDCADATAAYAMAYDWLYNAWTDLGYDVSVVESALYKKGILQGYRSTTGQECEYLSNQADLSAYVNAKDSWNVVSTSGMVIGSLALIGIDSITEAEGRYDESYLDYVNAAKHLLVNNIESLIDHGLDIYAPDGSFIESPTYWSYATNAFSVMSWAIETSVGNDLGLMKTWGIDSTFYSALQLEYSSYGDYIVPGVFDYDSVSGLQIWNYHEALAGHQNTDIFYYAAYALQDDALAAIRRGQLAKKAVSIWDVLGYEDSYADLSAENVELALDYVYANLEGVTSRSDWEDGAIYVGIMGNKNDASHGQLDSGNFIYANKNFTWFTDLGAEDYNVHGASDAAYRYGYYRNNAEGHNTVIVTSDLASMPQGQLQNGEGVLEKYYADENGMYAIINNTDVYGDTVNSAYRGMLFTNSRSTVVIQDEIVFMNIRSAAWVAQTAATEIIIDPSDYRSAILRQEINGEEVCIRATIVSSDTGITFSTKDAYSFFVSTHAKNFSTKAGKAPEFDRSMYKKLVIQAENVLSFECAVVIERVENALSDEPVQYEYTAMKNWTTSDVFVPTVVDETHIGNSDLVDIKTYGTVANGFAANRVAFTTRTEDFFKNMAYVAAAVEIFGSTGAIKEVKEVWEVYQTYLTSLEMYNMYKDYYNELTANNKLMSMYLGGYT